MQDVQCHIHFSSSDVPYEDPSEERAVYLRYLLHPFLPLLPLLPSIVRYRRGGAFG